MGQRFAGSTGLAAHSLQLRFGEGLCPDGGTSPGLRHPGMSSFPVSVGTWWSSHGGELMARREQEDTGHYPAYTSGQFLQSS